MPAEFRPATQSERPWRDLTPGEQAAFTTAVFTNNIQVTFVAFAGGITLGVLTAASLIFNGIVLGAVGGLMIGAGNWRGFLELVTGHGVLELSCILVAGAAGLRLGWAIVAPGYRTRGASAERRAISCHTVTARRPSSPTTANGAGPRWPDRPSRLAARRTPSL